MDSGGRVIKTEYKVIGLSIFFGLFIWVIDAVIDYLFFYKKSFQEMLISDIPDFELYIRSIFFACFLIFGMVMLRVLAKQKQADEALCNSEEQYRLLFESNPHPMWVYDLETLSFLAANDAAVHHYGYSKDEFLAQTIKDIHPAEDIPALLEKVSKIATGLDTAGIWRHRKKDGSIIYVEILSHTLIFAGRRAVVVLANDITERRLAEEALQQSEEKYSTLIDNIQDGVFIIQDAKIQFANEAFARVAGYTVEEVIGRDFTELVAPEQVGMVTSHYSRRQAGENVPRVYEFCGLHKNGTKTIVNINVGLINYRGRVASMGTVKDITERKRAEEKLQLFRNLIDQSNDAIFVIDPETGRNLDVNDKACSNLGYKREELLHMRVLDFEAIIPDHLSWKKHVKDVQEKGYVILEGLHRRKDGTTFPVEVNVNLILLGKSSYMVAVVRDITERKRTEEEIKNRREYLEAIMNSSIDLIFTVKKDGRFGYTNKRLKDILGYEFEDIKDRYFMEFIPKEMHPLMHQKWVEIQKGIISGVYETKVIRANGSILDCLVSPSLLRGFDEYLIILKDITERKRAEELLKEKARAELYGFLVSALPVFASSIPSQVRNTLVRTFAERFEKNVMPRFEEEMKRLGYGKKIKGDCIEGSQEVLDVFILWLSGMFSNFGIQTKVTSESSKAYLEFLNCPWIDEASGNPIFCLICRTIVIRSFTWTSLKGSADQKSSIANGSQTCMFQIHI